MKSSAIMHGPLPYVSSVMTIISGLSRIIFFSFFSEEIFEECGAFIGADAGCNGSPVIEKRTVCQLEQGPYGTCLRVSAAVDYPVQTAVDDGSGAHGTGLTGDIERTAR